MRCSNVHCFKIIPSFELRQIIDVSCSSPLIKKTSNYHLRNRDSSVVIGSRRLSGNQRNLGSIPGS